MCEMRLITVICQDLKMKDAHKMYIAPILYMINVRLFKSRQKQMLWNFFQLNNVLKKWSIPLCSKIGYPLTIFLFFRFNGINKYWPRMINKAARAKRRNAMTTNQQEMIPFAKWQTSNISIRIKQIYLSSTTLLDQKHMSIRWSGFRLAVICFCLYQFRYNHFFIQFFWFFLSFPFLWRFFKAKDAFPLMSIYLMHLAKKL